MFHNVRSIGMERFCIACRKRRLKLPEDEKLEEPVPSDEIYCDDCRENAIGVVRGEHTG